MIIKKSKLIIILMFVLAVLFNFCFFETNVIAITKNEDIKIDTNCQYNKDSNTATVTIISNNELEDTKPTWTLSEDKKSYSKVFDANIEYTTPVQDIYGNIVQVSIKVTKLAPIITVEYIKNTDRTITVALKSNVELANTKPTWTLSEDKKTYSKVYDENTEYTTPVQDTYGNEVIVEIKVTQITENALKAECKVVYNSNNTATVTIISNNELENTKPTWTLSEDKKSYSKVYDANTEYTTPVQDINGNIVNVSIKVTKIAPIISVEYIKNADGTITVALKSNVELANTKPTWTLSEDKKTYSKVYEENTEYTTLVQDTYGNQVIVEIKVTQITENTLKAECNIVYNSNNTATVTIISNNELENTKPTWTLSEDKKSYSKVYDANTEYTTPVQDINGNIVNVSIKVTKIAPIISVEYIKNADGTITVALKSNVELANTKPTWTLSEDKKTYSKVYDENTEYTTPVQDTYGNEVIVEIKVTQITENTLKAECKVVYNSNNTATVTIISNNELENTKPTWTLSEDKKSYSKVYDANTEYTTPVQDINGNIVNVSIKVSKLTPIITVEYIENAGRTVTVVIHSNCKLANTKPTWKLSEDSLNYTKTFTASNNYTTPVVDIFGNQVSVEIVVKIQGIVSNFESLDESRYPGYKERLRDLQNAHPNWIINIDYTGLDWSTVLDNEDVLVVGKGGTVSARSLTQYTDQWRNGDPTQYETGWYRASRAAIAYMMDPRNSFDDEYVFQFQELATSQGTYSEIATMIDGTFLTKYEGASNTDSIINSILNSAQMYNISPYHLVSRMLQEQGKDGGTLNGYSYGGRIVYNLFNIGATNSATAGSIENGAAYAYSHHWVTPEACIKGSAEFLVKDYISIGQSTLYYQKYDVVGDELYSHQYMTNIRAANDEGQRMGKDYKKNGVIDLPFEFTIPVYENMPQTPCARPNGTTPW